MMVLIIKAGRLLYDKNQQERLKHYESVFEKSK